ncbi:hypothetical protein XENTR_v10012458 [Xenopus tropicalis]|nr:hypothetical protein XENTR_v10012458 [Xenopus tropicalis]
MNVPHVCESFVSISYASHRVSLVPPILHTDICCPYLSIRPVQTVCADNQLCSLQNLPLPPPAEPCLAYQYPAMAAAFLSWRPELGAQGSSSQTELPSSTHAFHLLHTFCFSFMQLRM